MFPQIQIRTGPAQDQVLELNNGDPFRVVDARGLGLPPVNRLSERSPAQHGSTDLGFRAGDRHIFLTVQMVTASPALLDHFREVLFHRLSPYVRSEIVFLRFIRDNGDVRQLDCYVNQTLDLELNLEHRPGNLQRFVIPLIAPNPVWYDPTLKHLTFASTVGGSFGFQVPMEVPWIQQQGAVLDALEPVTYGGSWPEYPTIIINGPATGLLIRNETTGRKLDFAGSTIGTADVYTIRTAFGEKEVLNSAGSSVYHQLTPDSDLDDWLLAPWVNVFGGINSIRVQAGAVNANTKVRIEYHERFSSL